MKTTLELAVLFALFGASAARADEPVSATIERKSCRADDGVSIVYSVAGKGDLAIVFIHGGMADRGFWSSQLKTLSDKFRVVVLDLAGHGESGTDRRAWGIPEFGGDVRGHPRRESEARRTGWQLTGRAGSGRGGAASAGTGDWRHRRGHVPGHRRTH